MKSRLRFDAVQFVYPQTLCLPLAALVLALPWWRASGVAWVSGLALVLGGLLGWTLVEYLLHRFVLHGPGPFGRWHQLHHRAPQLPLRTPLLFSGLMCAALVLLPALLLRGAGAAAALSCGLLLGHALQEAVHHRLHGQTVPRLRWLAGCRRRHRRHHQLDAQRDFGTLSGFWDRLFGTAAPPL